VLRKFTRIDGQMLAYFEAAGSVRARLPWTARLPRAVGLGCLVGLELCFDEAVELTPFQRATEQEALPELAVEAD
jgi:hypothetical protein